MQKASTHTHKKQCNEYVEEAPVNQLLTNVEESAKAVEPINGQSPII